MGTGLATYLRENPDRLLVFDGGMGSCLVGACLTEGDYGGHPGCHEVLNLTRPDVILKIHRDYFAAGAQVVETNSFGGAAHVLAEHGLSGQTIEVNRNAAALARRAAAESSAPGVPRFVAGSIGPGSKLPSLGQIPFTDLVASYKLQAAGLAAGGVDCFIVETSQDLLQLKAAILAIREIPEARQGGFPIIAQATIDKTGRTLTGSDIATVLAALESLPVLAIGINCGLGPDGMSEAIHYLAGHSSKLLSVMPNAGLPRLAGGAAVYALTPDDFARQMKRYAEHPGLNIVGGCCGTTPAHIRALADSVQGIAARRPPREAGTSLSSLYQIQETIVSPKPLIIGERTNATGSRAFKSLLLQGDFEGMAGVALEQEREGAHLIDLSVAAAGRNEKQDMRTIAALLNQRLKIPVMIDSTDPAVIEAGLTRLAGRCAVNSVNLEGGDVKATRVIELCVRYGAALVCLAIDERGMAMTADRKVDVAGRLRDLALRGGLRDRDLFFDLLTFTLGSGEASLRTAGVETLEGIAKLKSRYPDCRTSLGASNVSHGLPPPIRPYLNSVFLHHAIERGLDAAILHAGRILPMHRIPPEVCALSDDLIFDRQGEHGTPLEKLLDHFSKSAAAEPRPKRSRSMGPERRLTGQILDGDSSGLDELIRLLLKKHDGGEIIHEILLPAMDEVGALFAKGELHLPFVLRSAEVVKRAMALLEPRLGKKGAATRGTLVLATVRGDIHDIGKNLVDMILSANGYRVINLGVRQSAEEILAAASSHGADAIGLSGLLVESVRAMREYLEVFRAAGLATPVICGGAALTEDHLMTELTPVYSGPVLYAKDAIAGLKIMNRIMETRGSTAAGEHAGKGKTGRRSAPAGKRVPRTKTGAGGGTEGERDPRGAGAAGSVPRATTVVRDIPPDEIFALLDRKALFSKRWKLGSLSQKQKLDAETRLLRLWTTLDAVMKPQAVFGIFPAEELRIHFKSAALRAHPVVGLQLVTLGTDLRPLKIKSTEEQFLLHGLAAEAAEAMAEWCNARLAREAGWKRTKRLSPGYPAWPELSEQLEVFRVLEPGRIGVTLSETYQMIPEYSTSAAVIGA
jgi:5-methyltetrahydrofolate--homocysteine methyltransferase